MWKIIAAGIPLVAVVCAQDVPRTVPPVKTDPAAKPKIPDKPVSSLERQRLSVERQMQAIRQHYPPPFAGSGGAVADTAPPADCPPISAAAVKPIIDREASRQKMDARLVQAVVEAESAYSPCAVSPVGAMGLMQLMPATAELLQVSDPYDPDQNIAAGTQYLKQMLERYGGDIAKALAAYNSGPGRVDAAGGIPSIPETQEYVRKIMGKITPPRPVE
ncbi:MAG: lytic transglycosylase domain-containing protein [Bryobacteraceae bacterium]